MRAIRLLVKGTVKGTEEVPGVVEAFDLPDAKLLSPTHLLVMVLYFSICGTDVRSRKGRNQMCAEKTILGHEIAVVIVEIGGDVPGGLKVGDKGSVFAYNATCGGTCSACLAGKRYACEKNETYGVQRHGLAVQYASIPYEQFVAASATCDPRLIAVTEALAVGAHAANRIEVMPEETVLVVSSRAIGLGAIARAVTRGGRVSVLAKYPEQAAAARAFGALNVVHPDDDTSLKAITGGRGFDVVIEAAGAAPDGKNPSIQQAITNVKWTGRVANVAYTGRPVTMSIDETVKREVTYRGSRNSSLEDFGDARDFIEKHPDACRLMITKEFGLEDAEAAFDAAEKSDSIRCLIKMS